MDELAAARGRIDEIDAALAELFEARMAAAAEIARWKQANGRPIRDPAREAELLARNEERISDPALRPYFHSLQQTLFSLSRAYQSEHMERAAHSPAESGKQSVPARKAGRVPVCNALSPLLDVPSARGSCRVFLRRGCLGRASEVLPTGGRTFIVTDDGVPAAYAGTLAPQFPEAAVYTVPQGESSKSPPTLTELLRAMLEAGLTREDRVIALGGGVVGDLAGLAAALYMRGIDWYYIPTTLLAMVDASVGGKTAMNLAGIKNSVGAFWPPRAVLMDPKVLETLPKRQLSNGLAEAVKMALTHDPELFARFEDPDGPGPMEEVIAAALRIKAGVVSADERESGLRRVLNFGHTLGHGIEAAAEGRLLHGECVALGMLPMCAPEVLARLVPVLQRLGLPTKVDFSLNRALQAVAHDKKSTAGGVQIVTLLRVGEFRFETVSLDSLRERLLSVCLGDAT